MRLIAAFIANIGRGFWSRLPDVRSNWITSAKWFVLFMIGYFMLHPIAGLYNKSDYRDVIFMLGLAATGMGIDMPIAILRRAAWKEDVQRALETEPPKK
jgi:hypothetical protein